MGCLNDILCIQIFLQVQDGLLVRGDCFDVGGHYRANTQACVDHGQGYALWDDNGWWQILNRGSRSWDEDVLAHLVIPKHRTPIPLPSPIPSPAPSTVPSSSDCPGGSLPACTDLCAMDAFEECVDSCHRRCRGTREMVI